LIAMRRLQRQVLRFPPAGEIFGRLTTEARRTQSESSLKSLCVLSVSGVNVFLSFLRLYRLAFLAAKIPYFGCETMRR
jgi:hypothetical protein